MSDKADSKTNETGVPSNFIKDIIIDDIENKRIAGPVHTRFPPEPNGYLHIGHAKSICLNFGLAKEFGGKCNLRFDDTNPITEDTEYVDSIMEDIHWLGFDWEDRLYYASDYFDQLYEWAIHLVKEGKAYIEIMGEEEIRENRGNYYTPAKETPGRSRSIEENLELFEKMKNGEFKDGECVLRARADLTSSNMNLRDPVMYRIKHAHHHRTGDKWCIYPMYDFAHGQSDAIEKITHSICTLEFQDHRPLYDWYVRNLPIDPQPHQYEFARLNLNYTVMSKRRLLQLVNEKLVDAWDDPRMPTISGMRRRGYTPASIRTFAERIGVAKADSMVDIALLEHCVREDLNDTAPRLMGVLDPIKLIIDNYPEGKEEFFDCPLFPDEPERGTRKVPFSREIYVERDDFREEAPRKWHRLAPGKEVRLRYACLITCTEVVKDANGKVIELHATWDPESRGGRASDNRKVRGTLHWVSAKHARRVEVRLYDRLFSVENPMDVPEGSDWKDSLNKDSLSVLKDVPVEPALAEMEPGKNLQFERIGYFIGDSKDSTKEAPVFNRTVTLRDSWARIERSNAKTPPPAEKKERAKKKDDATGDKTIQFDDFAKLELRAGIVRESTLVEGADKLIKLMVDLGEEKPRQIFSGIRASYPDPSVLTGKTVVVVANLAPRKMKFGISEGMVLSAGEKDKEIVVLTTAGDVPPGTPIS